MTTTPLIKSPDGVSRESFFFTTTLSERFFQGTLGSDVVDVQVSIRGGAYTSSPNFVVFENQEFTVPNPQVYPDGLELSPGDNLIQVRAINLAGEVSTPAEVQVRLIQDADLVVSYEPPSGLQVERFDDAVQVSVRKPTNSSVVGVNFYASQFSGGGSSGYTKINLDTVRDFESRQETSTLQTYERDATVSLGTDGALAADPMYLELRQKQTRGADVVESVEELTELTDTLAAAVTRAEVENTVKTDYLTTVEIPETARTLRTQVTLEAVETVDFASFRHVRTAGPTSSPPTVPVGAFAATDQVDPLYYVATAVYFDAENQQEVESVFSSEVFGNPVSISLSLGNFPAATRRSFQDRLISGINRTRPEVSLEPGAVVRDTVVDPVSEELLRVRLVVDFLHRSQSFDTLLQVDGVQDDGTPVSVESSAYKQGLARAFSLGSSSVQALFDQAFEQLAARSGQSREPGKKARGLVTFFTNRRPSATLQISQGTRVSAGSLVYVTTEDASMPLANIASFFNPTTGVYSIDVPIRAEQAGTSYNVGPGQVNSVTLANLGVTNTSRVFGGLDLETNLQLAEKSKNATAAVDSGTEAGYRQTASGIAGVRESVVVGPGDDLMHRDYDSDVQKHVFGHVDTYVRAESLATVTDRFAFSFTTRQDRQFAIVGDPADLRFQALDSDLSVDNPLKEVLNTTRFGLRNATSGLSFDLTDLVVEDYRTVVLSTAVSQPEVTLGDVILGDYRLQTGTQFVLPRQPVRQVLSVTGSVSGALSDTQFKTFFPDDPTLLGGSVQSKTYVDLSALGTAEVQTVTNEQHLMVGTFTEPLSNLGVDPLSVRLFNADRTVEYNGPHSEAGATDFTIQPGDETTVLTLTRVEGGQIVSGQAVSVDYQHDENFTVEYEMNQAVSVAQDAMDEKKHVNSNLLVKEALFSQVDLSGTIVLASGTTKAVVDRRVRLRLRRYLESLALGATVSQSDLITEVQGVDGVERVEVPLVKMARAVGSGRVREEISSSQSELIRGSEAVQVSTAENIVWLLDGALQSPTVDGGGDVTSFRAVYQGDRVLTLQTVQPLTLAAAAYQAYIIGNDGLSIPGYSDNENLLRFFPTATDAQLQEERKSRTANRVMVSLPVGTSPSDYSYAVSYQVGLSEGSATLQASSIEYFVEGNYDFSYVGVAEA